MHETSNKRSIDKYLSNHAETQVELSQSLNLEKRDHVLVIPCFDETPEFLSSLATHIEARSTLLILVLNEPDQAANNSQNERLKDWLAKDSEELQRCDEHLCGHLGELQFVLVDCTGERALPGKKAVGLARKIGADLAAQLIMDSKIENPWIYCSDADSTLPENYFSAHEGLENSTSAIVFNFEHRGEPGAVLDATRIYEAQLRFYREQLSLAGSPYAFFTLGSCLSVSLRHYCLVRGFPKKAAGEDFYLLNKLAKTGEIVFKHDISITIEARVSERVPFGTGPAVSKILEQQASGQVIVYYNPEIFTELRSALSCIKKLWENEKSFAARLSAPAQKALDTLGLDAFLEKRRAEDKSFAQFERSFHSWFDAFKTLKFIHLLQDSSYPPVRFSPTLG